MIGFNKYARRTSLLVCLSCSPAAFATNGYFAIGYGAKSMGMGGAGVAYPQDSLAAAANPAGMAHVSDGFDIGARFFSPVRDGQLEATSFTTGETTEVSDRSDREFFAIPNLGYVKELSSKVSVGVSVFGNGGLNTSYGRNIFDETFARSLAGVPPPAGPGLPAGATSTGTPNAGKLGVDLSQLIAAPTVTYNINDDHTFGASLALGYQRFSSRGLGNFAALSSDPGSLTNRGSDTSYGAGFRFGWLSKLHPTFSVGATYASKVYMTRFKKYDGLFADNGDFDIPANFALGLAWEPIPSVAVAADVQRILYSDVKAIANSGPSAAEFQGGISADRRLGGSDGIGFGWNDIWVYKLGVHVKPSPNWDVRLGYNHGESPIPDREVLINILAPGIVQDHATVGLTYRPTKSSEVTMAYMHAFDETQRNSQTAFLGAPAEISMHQNSLEVSYALRF